MNCFICNHEDHAEGEPCTHRISETRQCSCTKKAIYRAISVPSLGQGFAEQLAQLEAVAAALAAAGIRLHQFGRQTIVNPVNDAGQFLDRKVIVACTDDPSILTSQQAVDDWNAKVSLSASHAAPVMFSTPSGTLEVAILNSSTQ